MARFRKKRGFRRAMRSVGRSYRRSNRASIGMMDIILAGAIYGVARPTVTNMLPTFFTFGPVDSDNVILGGAGYMASKSSSKLIKALGLVAMGTEAGIITSKVVSGQGNGSASGTAYEY